MKDNGACPEALGRRLDQWLWFARLVKSRSRAARLCIAGVVTVNQVTIKKANHLVRIGDTIVVPQGDFYRTVRVLEIGCRRGPVAESRRLYEEIAAPVHRSELSRAWTPLLAADDPSSLTDEPAVFKVSTRGRERNCKTPDQRN